MDLGIWFLRALALLLAFGAGWSFGRAIPSWRIDRKNEDLSDMRGRYDGSVSNSGGGCGYLIGLFFQGAWGTVAMTLGAIVLSVFAWPAFVPDDSAATTGGGSELFAFSPQLFLLLIGLAGYIVSRVTDKGPMGPLE